MQKNMYTNAHTNNKNFTQGKYKTATQNEYCRAATCILHSSSRKSEGLARQVAGSLQQLPVTNS